MQSIRAKLLIYLGNESAGFSSLNQMTSLQALPYVSQHRKRGSRELELKLLALTASGATTIGDLERSFGGAGIEVRSALFALVFEGKLQVDFSGQADLDSRISKKR